MIVTHIIQLDYATFLSMGKVHPHGYVCALLALLFLLSGTVTYWGTFHSLYGPFSFTFQGLFFFSALQHQAGFFGNFWLTIYFRDLQYFLELTLEPLIK